MQRRKLSLLGGRKNLGRKLQNLLRPLERLHVHSDFDALGHKANHQPERIRKIEVQPAIRFGGALDRRLAMRIQLNCQSCGGNADGRKKVQSASAPAWPAIRADAVRT